MFRVASRWIPVFAFLIALPTQVQAAPQNPNRFAVTDPSQADDDFDIQGEYLGSVRYRLFRRYRYGLQVIARGDGKFDAVKYDGGLPGWGWNGGEKEKYSGARADDSIVLKGATGSVVLYQGGAQIRNSHGAVVCYLGKIQRSSPTLGACAPYGATVLFDGRNTDQLEGAKIVDDGLLDVGFTTKQAVGDFRLHVEFRLPYMPYALGQQRGNSGVYVQRRYEVQVLDSFGLDGAFNECGALYRTKTPDLNMCLPPLSWQTYDIYFTAARWGEDGKKTADARFTVYHNGVAVQNDYAIPRKTGAGKKEAPTKLPIHFQNHGNPVRFRNLWIVKG
jgi:hypothetical protein